MFKTKVPNEWFQHVFKNTGFNGCFQKVFTHGYVCAYEYLLIHMYIHTYWLTVGVSNMCSKISVTNWCFQYLYTYIYVRIHIYI